MTTQTTTARRQMTVPATASQILFARSLNTYEGSNIIVCMVGKIRKIESSGCDINLQIHDHTGYLNGIIRLDSESDAPYKLAGVTENRYYKVMAAIRDMQKCLQILKMVPVNDCNIITNHYLQCAAFALQTQQEMKKQLASASSTGNALADSLMTSDEPMDHTFTTSNLNELQQLVFDIVRTECSNEGITRRSIFRQFPNYQLNDVKDALDFLVTEGIIYYCIDQEHLKAVL